MEKRLQAHSRQISYETRASCCRIIPKALGYLVATLIHIWHRLLGSDQGFATQTIKIQGRHREPLFLAGATQEQSTKACIFQANTRQVADHLQTESSAQR